MSDWQLGVAVPRCGDGDWPHSRRLSQGPGAGLAGRRGSALAATQLLPLRVNVSASRPHNCHGNVYANTGYPARPLPHAPAALPAAGDALACPPSLVATDTSLSKHVASGWEAPGHAPTCVWRRSEGAGAVLNAAAATPIFWCNPTRQGLLSLPSSRQPHSSRLFEPPAQGEHGANMVQCGREGF